MSGATSRSRGEKGQARPENRGEKGQARPENRGEKGQATSAQPPPLSPDVLDIIPSRLAESEWLSIMSQEEGEDIVADLLEELINGVMDKCYEVDITNQLVPFAVAWAKDAMVQVIKGRFLMRDEGDGENVTSDLQEDTEPPPATIDSWAEGCVPVIRILNPSEERSKSDGQETDIKDPPQKHSRQSVKKTESARRDSGGDRKRNGRKMKLIPAAQAKLDLQRKPHPPEKPPPSKLKASNR